MYKVKVLGLTVIKYVGEVVVGHNCDFERVPQELEKYVIHCLDLDKNEYVDILLKEYYGECCSGWTTASWGDLSIVCRPERMPWTHRIKKECIIEFDNYSEDINNDVFSFSYDGDDSYYPGGFVDVNMELFEEAPRAMKKRPVWIFKGDSGLGKSTIGMNIESLKVFETDSVDVLPDIITEDVIIFGNRSGFTVEDLKAKLFGDPEVIIVEFKKENRYD